MRRRKKIGHTESSLRRLARDIHEGRVFTSWDIPAAEFELMLPTIFLPLMLTAAKTQFERRRAYLLYEYKEKAIKMASGYPMFRSVSSLTEDETKILRTTLEKLKGGDHHVICSDQRCPGGSGISG